MLASAIESRIPASSTTWLRNDIEVGLISGHSYRIQVIAHDGDQNKGGDSGEKCVTFCAGTGTLCDPGVTECVENPDGATCPAQTSCVQGCCLPIIL